MTYKLRIALLAVAGLLALPVLASAFHWPNQGGDPGRSGFQPVDQAALPITPLWAASDSGKPHTSVVTSGGATPSERVLAYGKDNADVHIRQLDTGAERTSESTRNVDDEGDDADTFGPDGGVSFVDSSSSAAPGQLYVVHNDDNSAARTANRCGLTASSNDIAIARFDEATGAKEDDFAVGPVQATPDPLGSVCPGGAQVSAGYTVESAPVITPPLDADGTRWIYFVARPDSAAAAPSAARLFGVRVSKADSPDAVVHSDSPQVRTFTSGVNTKASPTLLYLNDPQSLTSSPRLYVAVAGQDIPDAAPAEPAADIRTYAVGDIADPTEDGPTGDAGGAGVGQTPSVPVTASGRIPGPGTSEPKAPAIYAAYNVGDSTTVRKFVQSGSSSVLDVTSSPESIAGAPAPGLALSVLAANGAEAPGRVIVTTTSGLVLLNSSTLAKADEFDAGGAFSRNIAAASGELIFVTNNAGDQAVLSLTDGEPVAFSPNPANAGADFALGQPAYSDGFLQFLTDAGVFVYRTAQITEPPVPKLTITPNPVRQGAQVTLDGSGSTDSDGTVVRYELDLDGNGAFETDLGSEPKLTTAASAPPGTYKVFLRVTDDDGATGTTSQDLVVAGNQAPAASFTFTPNPAKTRQKVTFDATASKDADGSIAKYEWDLNGNGTFERTTTEPTTARRYRRAALYNVKVRVTDNEGATGEATQQVVVTEAGRIRARRLGARVRPRSDTTPPRTFVTKGRLVLPKGVSRKRSCRGRVTVVVKAGKDTISRRATKLRRTCRYRSRVTFDERERLDSVNKLRFKARFQGNRTVLPRQAKTRRVRISE